MAWLIAASGAQYGRRARDMEIRVLGPVEASVGGRPVALGAGKPRALLAMLALNAGSAVSVDRLIEGLWGERPPATAGKLLQVYVSRLRKALAAAGGGGEPELAELMAGLDDAFAGRGRLFLVVGEPGIGKSRLAEEVMRHARARGARVLVGRCWEAGGAPAYWPWVQALRAAVRDTDSAALLAHLGAGAAPLAQIVPELRQRFPDLPEPPALESEAARFRLFDATAEFLGNISQAPPTVLVLDDLHAADAPSLLLLRFLARELGSARILLLAAYRDVDPIPGRPLTETLAEVTREPVTRRVSLAGLSEREVAQYVERTASQ